MDVEVCVRDSLVRTVMKVVDYDGTKVEQPVFEFTAVYRVLRLSCNLDSILFPTSTEPREHPPTELIFLSKL